MKNDRISVMVNRETFDSLKSFAAAMKRPASGVIQEALTDWLDTVGQAQLEALAGAASVTAMFRQPVCIDEYRADTALAIGTSAN